MDDEALLKKIKKIVHGDIPDIYMSYSMLAKPEQIMQLIKQDREASQEDMLHRFTDRLSWEIARGRIEMVSINVEQLVSKLTTNSEAKHG